jgi:ribonuclease VapC
MVLDTSAIVAVVLKEPGHERLAMLIDQAEEVLVAAPSVLEAGMVLSSRMRQDARPIIEVLLRQVRATVVPFEHDHAWAATGAFLRFGRGRHIAALNFGDCITYALASLTGQPLLYIGDEFGKTDIGAVAV